ncbi:MAG: aminoglycoside phosphotransferase family protein [bacterium]|nr:aminoglycoside phosphotransferase family protein [bacterium]
MTPEPKQVARALTRLLAERGMAGARLVERPRQIVGGFDTMIYGFRLDGEDLTPEWKQPLVVRLYTGQGDDERPGAEAQSQRFAAKHGFPALVPLVAEGPENPLGFPLMIVARVRGGTLLRRMTSNPLRMGYWLTRMAELQVQLHRVPVDDCPMAYDMPLVEKLLAKVRNRMDSLPLTQLEPGYDWLHSHQEMVTEEVPSLCHGDFHPMNILIDRDGSLTVIDWTDATVGDRHFDVAHTMNLFRISKIAAVGGLARLLLRLTSGRMLGRFLDAYERLSPVPLDPQRLAYWEAHNAFVNWLLYSELPFLTRVGVPTTVTNLPANFGEELRQLFWGYTERIG